MPGVGRIENAHLVPDVFLFNAGGINPFIERIYETLGDIVAKNMEPGLVDIWRGASGERESECSPSTSAWQYERAPFDGVYSPVFGCESIYAPCGRSLRFLGIVTEKKRHRNTPEGGSGANGESEKNRRRRCDTPHSRTSETMLRATLRATPGPAIACRTTRAKRVDAPGPCPVITSPSATTGTFADLRSSWTMHVG